MVVKVIRAFPRKTNATPTDEGVRIGMPGLFDNADKVAISVTFTYDMKYAEEMYKQWKHIAPTTIGGPATGDPEGEFTPGVYLKKGIIITSRGCPNKCWFCNVWKRNGDIRELPITDGWNVMDDNLLACNEQHIRDVFKMLKKYKSKDKLRFTGGLEAARLKDWHIDLFKEVVPRLMYFAYDTPDDYEPLVEAGKMLKRAGLHTRHRLMCYNLVGYPKDTIDKAEERIIQTIKAGFMPFAMLWKDKEGREDKMWKPFQRTWTNPIICGKEMSKYVI